jgi:hypothetical protein
MSGVRVDAESLEDRTAGNSVLPVNLEYAAGELARLGELERFGPSKAEGSACGDQVIAHRQGKQFFHRHLNLLVHRGPILSSSSS